MSDEFPRKLAEQVRDEFRGVWDTSWLSCADLTNSLIDVLGSYDDHHRAPNAETLAALKQSIRLFDDESRALKNEIERLGSKVYYGDDH